MAKQRVVSDPEIMMGKPVIAGARLTVELILEKLAAGETIDDLLAAHPRLTQEGVYAAMDFAAKALRSDVVVVARTAGACRSDDAALTADELRRSAEYGIADETAERQTGIPASPGLMSVE